MSTEKQIHANRNNAQNSTGPRTEEGKSRASQNALKHGLLARDAVIPGEDPAEFDAQLAALEDALQPEDALEHELVRQLADAQWRMRRLARLESGYLAACLLKFRHHAENFQPHFLRPGYEGETLLLGHAMLTGTQELTHLARYDAHLGRRFERALQQITHLREARDKRHAALAKQANSQPHRSAVAPNGANPRPSNGATPGPVHIPEPRPSAADSNYQTKPISTKPNEINELGTAIPAQFDPAPALSPQGAAQPGLGDNRPNANLAAGRERNGPHGPIPNRN